MRIPKMLLTGAVCHIVVAMIFAVQMTGFAIACGSCLLHEAAVPPPPAESSGVLVQPGIFPVALAGFIGAGFIGIALVCVAAYNKRRMITQKESGR